MAKKTPVQSATSRHIVDTLSKSHVVQWHTVRGYAKCPCGSGKQFKNCCRAYVKSRYVELRNEMKRRSIWA